MHARPHLLVNLRRTGIPNEVVDAVLTSLQTGSEERFGALRILLSPEREAELQGRFDPSWTIETEPGIVPAANLSFAEAGRAGAGLLFLDAASAPDEASLAALERVLDRDPYFAFAEPRNSSFGSLLVDRLDPSCGDPELASVPRTVIDSGPEFLLIPDRVGACVLIRRSVVRDFAHLDESFETLRGALREMIARARRTGFRCVVANRAVVATPHFRGAAQEGEDRDMQRLARDFPELPELRQRWREHPIHEYESKMGRAASFNVALRKTLLIELMDLGPIRNGTSESVLGILGGIQQARRDWTISLHVSPGAADYHRLGDRFPEFSIERPEPPHRFTAAFRPTQPWSIQAQVRSHELALFNFSFMHDTISDDIQFHSPMLLDAAWQFLAENGDGIVYNSEFTRQRFSLRFPVAAWVEEFVCLHSLDPNDYCDATIPARSGDHIYVVGNDYPHKWMRQTIATLSAAFPYQRLKALGYEDRAVPSLDGLPSGQISEADVDALYSEARVIIYPSQYEGFGLPIVRGLSHGKDVVARRSALLTEIASQYRGPGRLIAYESAEELVEQIGRVLHGLPVETLVLGNQLAPEEAPRGWNEVGADIMGFIESRVRKPESSNWKRRQAFVSGLRAHTEVQGRWSAG